MARNFLQFSSAHTTNMTVCRTKKMYSKNLRRRVGENHSTFYFNFFPSLSHDRNFRSIGAKPHNRRAGRNYRKNLSGKRRSGQSGRGKRELFDDRYSDSLRRLSQSRKADNCKNEFYRRQSRGRKTGNEGYFYRLQNRWQTGSDLFYRQTRRFLDCRKLPDRYLR